MIQEWYRIREQKELAPGIYLMVFDAPELAKEAEPGQFINVYCKDKARLLPRPISIYDADAEAGTLSIIYAVVGDGTREFASYGAGEELRVVGPLGHGFPMDRAEEAEEIFIVGGGLGIPPMQYLSKELHKKYPEKPIKCFLGFRSEPWMGEEFAAYGEILNTSDDGACGFKGNVIDRMNAYLADKDPQTARVLYTCGPIPMMRGIQRWQGAYNIETWFSLEERMGCGFGACAGCPAKLRMPDGSIKMQGVCKLGPVFPGKDVIFDE